MWFKRATTSFLTRVMLTNSSTGAPLTSLTNASAGLIISTIADNEASATAYTVAGSNIETIATLGTFAAPSASKCRFKEVDATNHPGLYEIQLADARLAVASARWLDISISGAASLLTSTLRVHLQGSDPNDATVLGLSSLTAIKAKTDNLPDGWTKNTALNNFEFLMVNSSDEPATGLTITAERSIDGAAFSACTNSASEVSAGVYKINLSAADMNGDVITFKFSATGAKTRYITIKTDT